MLKLALFLAGAYLLFVALVYLGQNRLLYFPTVPGRELSASPENLGLAYEDVEIETTDRLRLHGWFVPAAGRPRGTLLFFHGNAGNISHRLDSIRQFHDFGLSVFIIDYRGYGQSQGRPSEQGTYRDAQAAWRYLTQVRGTPPERIIVFGRSVGGAIAAWLAREHTPGGLIVESTFSSVPELAAELYRFLPVRWLSRFRYTTSEYVAGANCPVLVIHSREDDIIPFHHGEAVFRAANEPRMFLEIGGPHNGAHILDEERYLAGVRRFLRRLPLPSEDRLPVSPE